MSSMNHEKYAAFKMRQTELIQLIEKTREVLCELNMDKSCAILSRMATKVGSDAFKIQVVGTFKNGKSTFINSFLGEEILPAYAIPCTAVINEVKYAKEKYAVLHFKNPLPKKLPSEIPAKTMEHMERYMFASVPPLRIGYDEIEDYVVIPIGKDPSQMLLESPYSKVELYWPMPLLENGVEIIDSPGLNEHATRTQVTMEYLAKADAILFVLNAQAICTRDEMRFVENNLKAQGFDEPYFIVNRFDCVTKEEDRIGMKRFAKEKLGGYTNHDIFFVSARNALDGKMKKDGELLCSSGMMQFEANLANYLTGHKGKIKLAQPAKELKRIIGEEALMKVIPMQQTVLGASLDSVKAKYERAKPRLDLLTRQKDQFSNKMKLRIEQLKPDLTRLISRNYRNISDSVPAWLEEYRTTVKLGLIPSKMKINALVKELSEYLAERLDEYQADWNKNTLLPFIKESAEAIFEGIDDKVIQILTDVDDVNRELSGESLRESVGQSAVERIKAGNFRADKFTLADGEDFTEKLGRFFSMMCLGSVLVKAFTVISPSVIIGTLTGKVMGAKFGEESMAVKKIKDTLADDVIHGIASDSEAATDDIVHNVTKSFNEIVDSIILALDAEIVECDNQINSIIAEMEKGKEHVSEKETRLKNCTDELKRLNIEVDKLIFKLIEG